MDNSLDGSRFLNSLTALIVRGLDDWMDRFLGSVAGKTVAGGLTWEDLGVILFFVVLALSVNALLAFFFRKKMRMTGSAETDTIRQHAFRALGEPVYLLVWIYGIYLATASLLVKFGPDAGLTLVYECFDTLLDLGVFAVFLWLFFRLTRVLDIRLKLWASKTSGKLDDLFVPLLGKSLRIIVPVMGIIFILPILHLPAQTTSVLAKGSSILLIVAVAMILFQLVNLAEKAVLAEYDIKAADNLRARKLFTQVHIISKTLYAMICFFAVASALMLFEEVRHFGASLLASAGVVGVILGFAAQKMIANLFAGFQVAMAQPIRLDDVVVVEGEWGRIEEITLTYVVIHIWDDRRLVVPLSYFIEKPFQNWTRTTADLLGSVILWTDYTLPLEDIRKTLKEMIENHPLWDKRFWNLQVTDATETTMQIRVLLTSANSDKSWDLRCDIREKLISHIQRHYPQCLPKMRAQVGSVDGGSKAPIL